MYDSTQATKEHIKDVQNNIKIVIDELKSRANNHDKSKLDSPEKEYFDEYTPKLKDSEYGSSEYKDMLSELQVALNHHYIENNHHPENILMNEVWKDIKGYEGVYQVSDIGRVKRVKSIIEREKQGNFVKNESTLKPHITPKGYYRLQLTHKNVNKNMFVHTLVANVFIGEKPDVQYQVNHKDGNKLNNSVDNLEYTTPSTNLQHAYDNNLKKGIIKYVVYCKELDLVTFGTTQMEHEVRKHGYNKVTSAGIHRCITSDYVDVKHYDLTFTSYNIINPSLYNSPITHMNLIDIIEMILDWWSASKRHTTGCIMKSIEINQARFGYSDQLKSIFINTIKTLECEK